MIKEPIILVFEGAPIKTLDQIHMELTDIFKGTKYEDSFFITDRVVRGLDNPYADKLDKIIDLLSKINEREMLKVD